MATKNSINNKMSDLDIVHTASENDDHAFEIDCNAAGFGDVKGLDIDFITGTMGATQEEECILVNIEEGASTGGVIKGYEVLATAEGSASVVGYSTGINIDPILHNTGTFGDADDILNKAVDVTAALASGGAGAISIFLLDNETITIGDAAQFGEMEIILATGASGAGVAPTFEYSTGGTGFSSFSPSDGTNGFRNSGAILWNAADLSGWVANATGFIEVRITRTRNTVSTTPIIDELQIAALTAYTWKAAGDLVVKSIALADNTAYAVVCGGTTSAAPLQSIASVGTAGMTLTSNGAGALPTFNDVFTWAEVTGTSQAAAVNRGYITNNVGLVTVTLPTTAALGTILKVVGKGAGGWKIAQNASEVINMGSSPTTIGVTGSLASTDDNDVVELVCITADTAWSVTSSIGTITVA